MICGWRSTWGALERSGPPAVPPAGGAGHRPVGTALREVKVALMLERLGGGTVGDPVLLELVQMLGTLEYHDDRRQAAGHPDRTLYRGHHRQHRRHRDFQELEPLVEALVLAALAGIPADLVLQPVPGRILGGHSSDRP